MSLQSVLRELEKLGTAQNRKVYPRHGAPEPLYGVSFANLDKLAKTHRGDQALAEQLWDSGVTDARYLAARIADGRSMTARQLEDWARQLDHYVIVELFARHVVAPSPLALKLIDKWIKARGEWLSSAGWASLAAVAMFDDEMDDASFAPYVELAEQKIGKAPNRTRHEINGALIAIGTRSDALATLAIAAAARIGTVAVDHGETGCKTPDAVPYITKARAHRATKQAKAASKKKPARARA